MNRKKIRKRVVQSVLVIGVVIIPLLYSFLYLGAFWDPYSTLDSLPVAIVNNDKGASINGRERNLGQELCDELGKKNSLKFIVTDEATAKEGTEDNKYYAMLSVPADFSSDIATSGQTTKQTATITFSANEKRNYLASQILSKATLEIEENLRSTVNKEITAELSSKLKEVPVQMVKLRDGLTQLGKGSVDLKNGADELKTGLFRLAEGTDTFTTRFKEFQSGVSGAKSGAGTFAAGSDSLDSGIGQLLAGITSLENSTQDLTTLTLRANQLAAGASQFNASLILYTDGVSALIKSVNDTGAFLSGYVAGHATLMADPVFAAFIGNLSSADSKSRIKALSDSTLAIKAASATISAGITQLAGGTDSLPKLQAAVSTLKSGLIQAKAGSAQLAAGAKSLSAGMSALSEAADKLGTASKELNSGASAADSGVLALYDGLTQLETGISTAKTGVDTSIVDAGEQIKSLDGLDEFASKPVLVESKSINAVPNYGTAFAPYFLSLSLWVGAIIIFVGIFMDSENKFKILGRDSDKKILRTFIYLLIGFTQAVVLAVVLKLCLGLQVNHMGLYFAACCLVSVVFLSIVQFLMVFLKDIGKFLSLFLLIIQLTSCGGTFPMETVPKFFNVMYPFMPMTYSVNLFKEAISGGDMGKIWFNTAVLSAILLVFIFLTILLSIVKKPKITREVVEEIA